MKTETEQAPRTDDGLLAIDWSKEPAGDKMDRAVVRLDIDQGAAFDMAMEESGLPAFRPSRDILAALTLIEVAALDGTTAVLTRRSGEGWQCELEGDDWWSEGVGDTPALAICRAFLVFRED